MERTRAARVCFGNRFSPRDEDAMMYLEGDPTQPLLSMLKVLMGAMGVLCLVLAMFTRSHHP
jgi:hypothetical protein